MVNRRMSPDSATFYFYFISRFKEFEVSSGSNSPGAGPFCRDLTKTSPCSAGILPGLCIWKNQYPRYSPALKGTWLQMTGALNS